MMIEASIYRLYYNSTVLWLTIVWIEYIIKLIDFKIIIGIYTKNDFEIKLSEYEYKTYL